jgi:hypothetical protein
MNKIQFSDFLSSPASLSQESAVLLAEVLKAFPYCQTAQLLYVKSLHNQKSMLYNSQLKVAAAYATDRIILHDLINGPVGSVDDIDGLREKSRSKSDEQIVTELTLPVERTEKEKIVTPPVTRPSLPQRSPQEILDARLKELGLKTAESELKEKKNQELNQELKEQQKKEAEEKLRMEAEEKVTSEKILTEAREKERQKKENELAAKEAEEKEKQRQAAEIELADEMIRAETAEKERLRKEAEETEARLKQEQSIKQVILTDKKISPVAEPEPKTDPVDTDDILKTIQDLDILSDSYVDIAIDARIRLEVEKEDPAIPREHWTTPEKNPSEEPELSFTEWLKQTNKQKSSQEQISDEPHQEEKKNKESELIERFIKEEPKISKPKKEFYNPVNMARQSVVEDPEFVTETLASIYASQGNTAKAILAYQTLSLKYPEKKLYFASLIEKLESGNELK